MRMASLGMRLKSGNETGWYGNETSEPGNETGWYGDESNQQLQFTNRMLK